MTKKAINNQLEEMKGGKFVYAGQTHTINEFSIDDENGKFTIRTNLSTYCRKFESAEEFLKYWQPYIDPSLSPAVSTPGLEVGPVKENALADEMIEILRDNIKKVQSDANYVKQAQTINKNVNSIINVIRTKMDFVKQVKGSRQQ